MGKLHKLHGLRNDTLAYAVFLLLMFIGFTGLFMSLRYAEQRASADDTTPAYLASFIEQVNSTGTYTALDPSEIPACAGNPECFAFTIDTRLDADGGLTTTNANFILPTSTADVPQPYDWLIDWGDDSGEQNASGVGASDAPNNELGVSHAYSAPGQYQITIRPNGAATSMWMAAFGFGDPVVATTGANAATNRQLVLSIDTPITNLARWRFWETFSGMRNFISIPENLFVNLDTSARTNFTRMFQDTFQNSATNSTQAVVPAGLFDNINTSSATNLDTAWGGVFQNYAPNSANGTIPEGFLDFLDTRNVTNFPWAFATMFLGYAQNSPNATIPADLYAHIDTSRGTNLMNIFRSAFSGYARYSTTATIPAGLFDHIDTSSATNLNGAFQNTFQNFAASSTAGTIPQDLFVNIDTSSATTDTGNMFLNTFTGYATRTVTFKVGGAVVGTQEFASPYSTKNITTPTADASGSVADTPPNPAMVRPSRAGGDIFGSPFGIGSDWFGSLRP